MSIESADVSPIRPPKPRRPPTPPENPLTAGSIDAGEVIHRARCALLYLSLYETSDHEQPNEDICDGRMLLANTVIDVLAHAEALLHAEALPDAQRGQL